MKMWRDTIPDSVFEPLREHFAAIAKKKYPNDDDKRMEYMLVQLRRIRIFQDWQIGYTIDELSRKHGMWRDKVTKIVRAKYTAARRLLGLKAD